MIPEVGTGELIVKFPQQRNSEFDNDILVGILHGVYDETISDRLRERSNGRKGNKAPTAKQGFSHPDLAYYAS